MRDFLDQSVVAREYRGHAEVIEYFLQRHMESPQSVHREIASHLRRLWMSYRYDHNLVAPLPERFREVL